MRAITLVFQCLAVLGAAAAHGATLTEPATVFYGRVTNANAGGQVLHEGALSWTLSGSGDTVTQLHTILAEQDEGAFSYFIEVPHHVLSGELDTVAGSLPIGSQPVAHQHLEITLDGRPVTIDAPGGYAFDLAASARAATFRLDLSVELPVEDTDGDGMPDWLEEEQGLDPDSDDSALDPDGDGLSNLEEFLRGTSSGTDNRGPEILTSELLAYSGATTGVLLRTADLDSDPEQIQFTLTATPTAGELRLRGEDDALEAGGTFTGADVESGRLVFVHEAGTATAATKFKLTARDEDSAHATATGEIEVVFFTATDDPELVAMTHRAELGREHGYVIWDLTELTLPATLTQPEDSSRSNSISGGAADDDLSGAAGDDEIAGGEGDDRMTGSGGADRFVLSGNDRVTDFDPADGDVLDLRDALDGSSSRLDDYVQVAGNGPDTIVRIDRDGDGSGFDDMVVTLQEFSAGPDPLFSLFASGAIDATPLTLPPLVRIAATISTASELGPEAGEFTISRLGSTETPMTVLLQIAGSATNGVDYATLPDSIIIPAGEAAVKLPVLPFADAINEVGEMVEVSLLSSPSYVAAANSSSAHVAIANLKPEIHLSVLQPLAATDGSANGMFLISRSGDTSPGVLLRLETGGTASAGGDYTALPGFLVLAPGQTFALLEVTPTAVASVDGAAETITLNVLPDASYQSAEPTMAEIWLVEESLSFDSWAATNPDQAAAPDALFHYGFGQDRSDRPRVALTDDRHLTLHFHTNPSAADLDHSIEVAGSDMDWRAATSFEVLRVTAPDAVPGDHTYRAAQPVNGAGFQFLRVRLSR